MSPKLRKIKHYLEYLGTRLLCFWAAWLALPGARKVGRALGRFTFGVLRIRRAVTVANLAAAFPEKSLAEIEALARSTYERFGMMLMEFLRMPSLQPQDMFDLVQVQDKSPLDEARRTGRGVVLLTAHFGNWEYLGAWVTASGYPAVYLFQEQSNPYVSDLILRYRQRMGMEMIPRGMGVRRQLRALREGKFTAMVADQDAGRNGIFIDFFGQPASTAIGPARIAVQTGVPVLLLLTYRDRDDNLLGHVEFLHKPNGTDDRDATARAITEAYVRKLEEWIRRYPDHWFWMHRRWKTRPGGEAS